MIGLVVEAPLADGQSGSCGLNLADHFVKLLGLVLSKLAVVLHAGHVQLVLGLWLWRFKWAGQDSDFNVAKFLRKKIFFLNKCFGQK